MAIRKIQRYGWKPSIPDHRDLYFRPRLQMLPSTVDLRPQCPPVYDQNTLGSCTAFAIGGLAEFLEMKEKHNAFLPSFLFIYYNERVLEGTVNEDAGAEIRDGLKVVAKFGVPESSWWWYNVAKYSVKPNRKVYAAGLKHLVSNYFAIDNTNITDIKSCLADGFPVVAGFTVYESFESAEVANTGIVPMPQMTEQVVGGHAVLIVGFDDAKQWFIVRNSWNSTWGDKGYFYMPYKYFTNSNLASDFWTARIVA